MTSAPPFPSAPDGYKLLRIREGGFSQLVGPFYVDDREAVPRFMFMPGEHHANAAGSIHGGMMMTLADMVLGTAALALTEGARIVTVTMTTEFVGAARPGSWITGTAHVTRQTASLLFVRGEMHQDGALVLTANGIWKKKRPRVATS